MFVSLRFALVFMIVSACWLHAERIGTIERAHNVVKAENGFIIAWSALSGANENQIDVFEDSGRPVTSINVLHLVPEARVVGIFDVSVRPGMVAIAASYASKEGDKNVHPAFSLLIFNFSGQLVSAFVLEPSRQIFRLAIDEGSNIWTLTTNSVGKDPSTVPMIVEYAPTGTVLKELLPRSSFPLHARLIRETPSTGRTAMGYDSGYIWFWLPGSTDLVTVSVSDGKSSMTKTQLPTRANHTEVPLAVARESSGDIVAEFREDGDRGSNLAYYKWSPSTNYWSLFKPGACDGEWLIGAGVDAQMYLRREGDRANICSFSKQ